MTRSLLVVTFLALAFAGCVFIGCSDNKKDKMQQSLEKRHSVADKYKNLNFGKSEEEQKEVKQDKASE